MDVRDAVLQRRSVRGFTSQPVADEVLKQIVEDALWAPSWGNTQPWGIAVVSGGALSRITEECADLLRKGVAANPEFSMPEVFPEDQMRRYRGLAKHLFQVLGVDRGDRQRRNEHYEQMSLCFGAPHTLYLHLHKGFHPYALMDGGIILQTIALLAVEKELGTCFLARSIIYPHVVRKHVPIGDERVLVMGMAIGHPEKKHPLSGFRSGRGRPGEFIQWVGDSP